MPAIPSEEEWLEQTAKARKEAEKLEAAEQWPSDAPVHPIAQLQGPFEESITESTDVAHNNWQVYLDAETRRDQVLTAPRYERLCHVAELDGFIENTTEDILLAFSDIEERLEHLRLPLGNLPVFNDMLADRTFRQTVILDHGRINHIIHRTAVAMDDSVKDIEKGTQSVRILGFYLKEVRAERNDQRHSLDAVYDAMIGNVDGWKREFKRLKRKAYNLAITLGTFNQVAMEIQQLADAAATPTRPPSRGRRHRKHMLQTPETNRLSTISHRPLPKSPTEPDSYTAEARVVSIIAGHSPVTLVKTTSSRQETPVSQGDGATLEQGLQEKHSSKIGKQSNNHADRYVQPEPVKTPHQSVTTPELKININNKHVENERGSKKRSNTSSSRSADHHTVAEKGSTKSSAKFGSRLDRFQKTTSRIFSISALTNVKGTIRKQTKSKNGQRETFHPKERSWIDSNAHDQQMSWSQEPKDFNTFASRKSTAPELPHLLYKSFLDDQTLSDEEEEEEDTEDTEDSLRGKRDDECGHESQITALPVMKDSTARSYDHDDVAAEVASTYSARHRRFRAKNIPVPPLPKPKFNKPFELGASNGHVIHQNRQTLRQKPSVFSFISAKKAQETTSNSPAVKSRQVSDTPENQQPRPTTSASVSTSIHLHGDIEPPPKFNSSWHTHKGSPLENTETPPVSPTTLSNPMASSLPESKRPETLQPSGGHKNTSNINPRKSPTRKPPPPTLDFNQNETKKSDTLRANNNSKLRNASSSTTASTTHKPQHGGLRLFPRTPTTPNVRKFVSTSSLREFSAAESTGDIARLPRSRG
ncbi:hypothetical protein UA08_09105 [Talaromyces atroroseus]|uniref:Uncharacterized protein n=1 Tax=Talaromyces atroroseus TaxID=1441469 RepID=A0A1Q5Q715_TALAT|nr:hypothetical protein UA08_09105 [Talaromyces atroroseus]OKL55634.1 hypothetical protein UA08_09105 [Talaromyces atroroseus]